MTTNGLWILAQTETTQPAAAGTNAVTTAPAGTAGGANPPPPPGWGAFSSPMFMMALLLVMLWFVVLRPKQRQDKQRQQLLDSLKRGDRVQTIGGIIGTVVESKDNEVVVKVDESSNTKMRFIRSAIHRVVDEEKPSSATANK